MDFALGRITRPHEDVDWFVLCAGLDRFTDALWAQGWWDVGTAPKEQQRDLRLGDVELGIAGVDVDHEGRPVVGGGPWRGSPLPAEMLTAARRCVLAGVTAVVIAPSAQIEIKRMMPEWVPGMRRRPKDLEDITQLEALLAAEHNRAMP